MFFSDLIEEFRALSEGPKKEYPERLRVASAISADALRSGTDAMHRQAYHAHLDAAQAARKIAHSAYLKDKVKKGNRYVGLAQKHVSAAETHFKK